MAIVIGNSKMIPTGPDLSEYFSKLEAMMNDHSSNSRKMSTSTRMTKLPLGQTFNKILTNLQQWQIMISLASAVT